MNKYIEIEVPKAEHKKRLEDFLFERFTGLSKMYLRDIIKNEKCEVNGRFENRGHRLRANDFIEIEVDLTRETAMRAENVPLDVVFEDDQLLVVNKPAGMLAHPTHRDKNGTLLNALTFYLNSSWEREGRSEVEETTAMSSSPPFLFSVSGFTRPGLIHRLDKQTSGLMVVAKTLRAHRVLAEHFRKKLVKKRYTALVDGVMNEDEGVIMAPIGRFADLKVWDVNADGKRAETKFWVMKRLASTTLLELEPVTGRTNQLRIHCAYHGHPIVGDTARGGRKYERLCLHAHRLAFRHPDGGEWLEFEVEVPFTGTD